jgi:hypothetical protein
MKQKINCNWHKYVDLGLPSGLLWATCNIGASESWDDGLYFSWGNVDGREKWSWYDYGPYKSTPGVKLTTDIPVDAGYDAARANLGGSWRMPTATEFEELDDNCISKWTTQNGVNGRMFTSKINGNSVFFPAVGYYYGTVLYSDGMKGTYWSSSFISHTDACFLHFDSGYIYHQVYTYRFYGFPVRAVLDHPKDSLLIKTIKIS